jgi:outer membrane usher protein
MLPLRGWAAILSACLLVPAAHAGDLPAPSALQAGALRTELGPVRVMVQLVVNQRQAEDFVSLDVGGGRLQIAADDLRRAGIAVAGTGLIDLAAHTDMQPRYEPLEQRLYLDVDPALLPEKRLKAPRRTRVHAAADVGAALNYDLYLQDGSGTSTATLYTEQRLFSRHGMFSTSGVLRVGLRGTRKGNGYLRYDTRFHYVDQDRALALSAGDLITASLPWSSSVRLGGLQIGRNFAARPDLVTTPLPSFAGQAAVPSAVDLFINGYRHGRSEVDPGRFVLDDMPVVNGAGKATIVTTDAVGRQVATTIPFYVSASLLRPGLTDFSAEVGALRRGYGQRNFGYGAPAASFVARRGMNQRLTLAAHGEASRSLVLAGAGVDWAPGLWGTAHLTFSASRAGARSGSQLTVGYDYAGRGFSIAGEHRRTGGDYHDLGSFDLGRLGRRTSDRVVASTQLPRLGSLGLSYIDARARGFRTRLLSASWSLPIGGRVSAFASADYDLRRKAASGQVRLIVPLGHASVSGGLSRASGRGLRSDATFDLAVPTQGGIGVSAAAAVDEHGRSYGQASARLRTRVAAFEVGASLVGRETAAWASTSGSLIAMDGGVFAANDAPSSFAVVDTGKVAGVPVTYENQPIGKTDRHGRIFIRDVTAYHPGRIAIDPLALDAGLVTSSVETKIAVAEGAGAVVRLPIRRTRSVTATLVDALGQPLAAGSLATLPDGTSAPIGWDGILYLADLPGPMTLDVRRANGGRCAAHLGMPAGAKALVHLGAIPCS